MHVASEPFVDEVDQELSFVQIVHVVEFLDILLLVEINVQVISFALLLRGAKQRHSFETVANENFAVFRLLTSVDDAEESVCVSLVEGISGAGKFSVK